MEPTDDSVLLRQYAEKNSDEAFAALVTRHINLVYSVALRQVGNPHAAEEITQAVFIILAKKSASLRHEQALSSWLFQTTRLTANNFIRSESRRHCREEEAFMQSVLDEAGTEVWPRIAPMLDDAVGSLREKDRRAILLRFYEGRNLREVGLALGASEAAAEKRVNRALEKLRKFFTKRGVDSTAATIAETISTHSVQAAPVALAKAVTAVAIAKGAAASGSTLTLIKGALKIMAWTKAEAAVVVGVSLLLAAGTTTVVIAAFDKTSNPASADQIYEKLWASVVGQSSPNDAAFITSTLKKAPPILIVRPTHYPDSDGGGIVRVDGDKSVIANAPVYALIEVAYDYPPVRTVLPDQLPKAKCDLMATLPDGHNAAALKEEIKKQFGLVAHAEIRQTDTLLLMVKNSGKLQSHLSKEDKGVQLVEVAKVLERVFDIPILDRSGLTNRYAPNFHFQLPARNNTLEAERTRQSVRDQLDQFGLELVPSREPVKMLVVAKAQ